MEPPPANLKQCVVLTLTSEPYGTTIPHSADLEQGIANAIDRRLGMASIPINIRDNHRSQTPIKRLQNAQRLTRTAVAPHIDDVLMDLSC
jgi:hypothetical protein